MRSMTDEAFPVPYGLDKDAVPYAFFFIPSYATAAADISMLQ